MTYNQLVLAPGLGDAGGVLLQYNFKLAVWRRVLGDFDHVSVACVLIEPLVPAGFRNWCHNAPGLVGELCDELHLTEHFVRRCLNPLPANFHVPNDGVAVEFGHLSDLGGPSAFSTLADTVLALDTHRLVTVRFDRRELAAIAIGLFLYGLGERLYFVQAQRRVTNFLIVLLKLVLPVVREAFPQ